MNSSDLSESDPTLPATPTTLTTPKKREAEDWALVLIAEGIQSKVVRVEAGFSVRVATADVSAAREILDSWQSERSERSRRLSLPPPRGATTLEATMAYTCALALLAFHLGLEYSGRWAHFIELGKCQAALVLDGQWWRLVTALTLHADLPHVLGNTLFGGFFLSAVAGRLGIGIAVLSFVATGTLGNLANALYYGSAHSSVGASTGVFGLVGVLAGLAAWQRHQTALPGRGAWVALGAALAIVAMLGSGGPRVDFSAHLFGLAAGGLTGLLLAAPFASRSRPNPFGQGLAATTAFAVILAAWLQLSIAGSDLDPTPPRLSRRLDIAVLAPVPARPVRWGRQRNALRQRVSSNENRIRAIGLGIGQDITLLPTEFLEGRQTRAVIEAIMLPVPAMLGVVRDRLRCFGQEENIVLDDHDTRRERFDRLPDPVVVAVDIDRKQVEVLGNSITTEKRFDVLRIDMLSSNENAVRTITALHQKPGPAVVQAKVRRIREM
jgi:membrane associated rhomboid family serine protease